MVENRTDLSSIGNALNDTIQVFNSLRLAPRTQDTSLKECRSDAGVLFRVVVAYPTLRKRSHKPSERGVDYAVSDRSATKTTTNHLRQRALARSKEREAIFVRTTLYFSRLPK